MERGRHGEELGREELEIYNRARLSRDARFDGRFFIGVTSTGVYCRPICPARTVKNENVRFYPSAAAAEAAGFRPCLRCRPEASPGTPAWLGTSGLVSRALRLISEGALDGSGVDALADRLGVSARHLRRLFEQHLGATPLEVALTRRVHLAKRLVDETNLSFDEIALAAGFGSVRRFNSEIRRTFHRTPTELRRLARQPERIDRECYRFRLAYRPPYDWEAVLAFLAERATPGIETIAGARFRRTISVGAHQGTIEVTPSGKRDALELEVRFPEPKSLLVIVERVRRIFDLGADPQAIAEQLGDQLTEYSGVRVPGAWDSFELAVSAILASPALTQRVVTMFGTRLGDSWIFPSPVVLVRAPIESAGVPLDRAETIRALAAIGDLTRSALDVLPGLDNTTAEYIAMRALGEPDAFPIDDPELVRRAEAWRPWRAYAAMLLWASGVELRQTPRGGGHFLPQRRRLEHFDLRAEP
jgi:AraC family transcriptional regulator, regulatory protein of adaptative response / DNA-3-methyladenine glycosylase II